MALIERDVHLAAFRQYAKEARGGEGRLVLLAGEAGVGKSVLVEQFQRELPDGDWSWGSCDGLSTPRPLGPLFDLATQLGGRLHELCLGQPERDELFRALLAQVSAGDRLKVLVIEDLHWADEATLDLLRFLARRIRSAPALLIVTYRDDALAAGVQRASLRVALGELAALRWTRRLALAPLSPEAVRALAEGSALDAGELFELTGGNPFYVTEMIEARTHAVPLSARDAVLARTARLSEAATIVLTCATLMGSRLEPRVLKAATDCSPQVLDELIDSGLLVEESHWLRFRHEIARLALEQQIAAHRQPGLHAQILAALRSAGNPDDARIAFHAEGAHDEPAALTHSIRAARRAAELGSHREATAQYERALRFVSGADAPTAAALYVGLAQEAALGDRCQIAADADEKAIELWRALGDQRQEGDTLRHYSLALKYLCRGEESLAAAEQAVRTLEPLGPSTELAAAYSTLATVQMLRNERSLAAELARRAQALARPLGATAVIVDALNTEGISGAATNPRWTESLRHALELALSGNLQSEAGRVYCNLYGTLCDQFAFAEAGQYFIDGVAYCEEHDLDTHTYFLLGVRTMVLLQQGNWDEAMALALRLLDTETTAPLNRICSQLRVGLIRARRGEPEAWTILDVALAAAKPTGQPQYLVPIRLARAEAHLLEGRDDEACREAELAADAAFNIDPWMRGDLALWLQRTGSGRSVGDDLAGPYRLQRQLRHADAARAWDDLGCSYHAAMALLDARDDETALRTALSRFDDVGAAPAARLARRKLRDLGVRSIPTGPRRATRAHPLGLTPRERQVLELICAQQTNAEIAQALFISAKTVDHHVSSVLTKLDVETRKLAAQRAFRLGLVAGGSPAS